MLEIEWPEWSERPGVLRLNNWFSGKIAVHGMAFSTHTEIEDISHPAFSPYQVKHFFGHYYYPYVDELTWDYTDNLWRLLYGAPIVDFLGNTINLSLLCVLTIGWAIGLVCAVAVVLLVRLLSLAILVSLEWATGWTVPEGAVPLVNALLFLVEVFTFLFLISLAPLPWQGLFMFMYTVILLTYTIGPLMSFLFFPRTALKLLQDYPIARGIYVVSFIAVCAVLFVVSGPVFSGLVEGIFGASALATLNTVAVQFTVLPVFSQVGWCVEQMLSPILNAMDIAVTPLSIAVATVVALSFLSCCVGELHRSLKLNALQNKKDLENSKPGFFKSANQGDQGEQVDQGQPNLKTL